MACVVAVRFDRGIVFTDDGRTLPVTALIDEDGARTLDWRDAIRFVATEGAEVFVGRISDWTRQTIN